MSDFSVGSDSAMGLKNIAANGLKRASKAAVVCYGFGDLASQFVWSFVGSYLTIFYTDIVGLTPVAISAIMLIARIWDAFNDPMMGSIAERSRSRFGRFRPWIAFGSPLLAVFGVLTFTNPFGGGSTAGVIWAAVTYIIAGMLYTLVNIPYGAMPAVMSEDSNQRTAMNVSRNIGMNIGFLLVNALTAGIALYFSGNGAEVANKQGYMMTAAIYGLVSIPLFLVVFFTAKEVVLPTGNPEKFSFKSTVNNLVKNKYLMLISWIMLLLMTAFMGRIAITAYYVIYCLGSFSMIAIIMTIPAIGSIIGSLFVPFFVRRFGKKRVFIVSAIVNGIGLLIMYLAPYDNMTMIIIGDVIFGLFNVAFPLSLSMVADSVDYMDHKTGVRSDGTAYATYGLATKVGNAIGGSAGVIMLSAFGYVANAQQTVKTLNGINMAVNLIPAILYFFVAFFLLFWKMSDDEADKIREELSARRQAEVQL